jgi:hypothetical protein
MSRHYRELLCALNVLWLDKETVIASCQIIFTRAQDMAVF